MRWWKSQPNLRADWKTELEQFQAEAITTLGLEPERTSIPENRGPSDAAPKSI
jgi:hypothetical protein